MGKINGLPNTKETYTPINEIGRRLIELRLDRGKTQKEIAAAIGVNFTSYSAWEIGTYKKQAGGQTQTRRPVSIGSDHIIALSNYYGVSADYILGLTDFKSVDGESINRITDLSDDAIRILSEYSGERWRHDLPAAVSQLITDYEKNGSQSVLQLIRQYAATDPETVISYNTNTGRPSPEYGTEIKLETAILMQITHALSRFKNESGQLDV